MNFKRIERFTNEIFCSTVAVALVPKGEEESLQDDHVFHSVFCNEPLCKTCIQRRSRENLSALTGAIVEWAEDRGEKEVNNGAFVFGSIRVSANRDRVESFFKRALRYCQDDKEKYRAFWNLRDWGVGAWVVDQQWGREEESEFRILLWLDDAEQYQLQLDEYIQQSLLDLFAIEFDVAEVEGFELKYDGKLIQVQSVFSFSDANPFGAEERPEWSLFAVLLSLTAPLNPLAYWMTFQLDADKEPSSQIALRESIIESVSKLRGRESLHTFGLDFEESKPGKPVLYVDETADIYGEVEWDEVIYHYNITDGTKDVVVRRPFDLDIFEQYFIACEKCATFDERQSMLSDYGGIEYDDDGGELDNLVELASLEFEERFARNRRRGTGRTASSLSVINTHHLVPNMKGEWNRGRTQ